MSHLKHSVYINLSFRGEGTTMVKDVIERLKKKEWKNLMTNSEIVFYTKEQGDFRKLKGK